MNSYVVIILLPLFSSLTYPMWKGASRYFSRPFSYLNKINEEVWGLICVLFFVVLAILVGFTSIMENILTGTLLVFFVSCCTSLKKVIMECEAPLE